MSTTRRCPTTPFQLDLIVSHFYEAVIYYASLIHDVALVGGDILDINQILALMTTNYTFYSPIHGRIDLDDSGDRIFSYVILTFDPDVLAFAVHHRPSLSAFYFLIRSTSAKFMDGLTVL